MKKLSLAMLVSGLAVLMLSGSLLSARAESAPVAAEEGEGVSAAIEDIQYNAETKELTVVFKRGTYVYQGVPAEVYEALKNSESQGTYYRKEIRGKYTSTKRENS
jgi:hypothetical protein